MVKPCGQYADIAGARGPTPATQPRRPRGGRPRTPSLDEEADATYLCDHPTEAAEGEEGGH